MPSGERINRSPESLATFRIDYCRNSFPGLRLGITVPVPADCAGVALHERSVGKVLAKLGYRRLSVRPRHPQTDEEAQEAFKKTLPQRRLPDRAKGKPIEIWFQKTLN